MKQNINNTVELYDDEDSNNKNQVIELSRNKNLCDQFIEKFMSFPENIREKLEISIAAQGPAAKFPSSGFEFEIIPAKIQLFIRPFRS